MFMIKYVCKFGALVIDNKSDIEEETQLQRKLLLYHFLLFNYPFVVTGGIVYTSCKFLTPCGKQKLPAGGKE